MPTVSPQCNKGSYMNQEDVNVCVHGHVSMQGGGHTGQVVFSFMTVCQAKALQRSEGTKKGRGRARKGKSAFLALPVIPSAACHFYLQTHVLPISLSLCLLLLLHLPSRITDVLTNSHLNAVRAERGRHRVRRTRGINPPGAGGNTTAKCPFRKPDASRWLPDVSLCHKQQQRKNLGAEGDRHPFRSRSGSPGWPLRG